MKRLLWPAAVAFLGTACAMPLVAREHVVITGATIEPEIGAIAGSPRGRATEMVAARPAAPPAPVVVTPPPVVVRETPTWVLVPGTPVYYSPEIEVDVYLHGGIWYYRVKGVWFTGPSYRGPWDHAPVTVVPAMVTRIPPGWRPKPGPPEIPPGLRKKMGG